MGCWMVGRFCGASTRSRTILPLADKGAILLTLQRACSRVFQGCGRRRLSLMRKETSTRTHNRSRAHEYKKTFDAGLLSCSPELLRRAGDHERRLVSSAESAG